LIDRQNWESWEMTGSKSFGERVHEKVVQIIEAEEEPLMDEAMFKELRRVCELADERHKDEELDLDMFG
jgi:trimethylamine:corrinoid methyltransferase-like protein